MQGAAWLQHPPDLVQGAALVPRQQVVEHQRHRDDVGAPIRQRDLLGQPVPPLDRSSAGLAAGHREDFRVAVDPDDLGIGAAGRQGDTEGSRAAADVDGRAAVGEVGIDPFEHPAAKAPLLHRQRQHRVVEAREDPPSRGGDVLGLGVGWHLGSQQ